MLRWTSGGRRVQRRRVRQRPRDDLSRRPTAFTAGDRHLRLVGGIRAQEVLRPEVVAVELRPRRLRGPDGEAGLRRAGLARSVDHARRVDVNDVHRRGPGGELGLRQRIDLRAAEAVAAPRVCVGGQVDAVRISSDVRVVAQVRAGIGTTGVGAVVGHIDPVDVPRPGRVGRRTDRQVKVVDGRERTRRRHDLEREHDEEEALRRRVVDARRVGDELAADAGRSVDRGRVAVERVQVDGVVHVARESADDIGRGVVRKLRLSRGVEDVQDVVDGLDHVAVADAQRLVRRLDRELVAAARIALLVVVETLEPGVERRVRLRLLGAVDGGSATGAAREADRAGIRIRSLIRLLSFSCELVLAGNTLVAGRERACLR